MKVARPAILLDRDGAAIVGREYLYDLAQIELKRSMAEDLRHWAARSEAKFGPVE